LAWLLAVLLLPIACALVLEAYARAAANALARQNPYIQSHLAEGIAAEFPEPRPFTAQLAPLSPVLAENNRRLTEYFCSMPAVEPGSVEPAWARVGPETREQAEIRRLKFAGLSEVERQLFAALHAEAVVVLDAEGRVR